MNANRLVELSISRFLFGVVHSFLAETVRPIGCRIVSQGLAKYVDDNDRADR
jgi:hypothetical protein